MELYLPRHHDVNGVTTSVFVLNQSGRDDLNNANLSITPQTNEIAVGSTILSFSHSMLLFSVASKYTALTMRHTIKSFRKIKTNNQCMSLSFT